MYSPKYVDYLDKKRIDSAFYNPKSKPKTWVGMIAITRRFAATQRTDGFSMIYCQFAAKTFWLWKSHVVKLIQEWKRIGSRTSNFSLLTLWNPAKGGPTEWEASSKLPYMTLSGSFSCFSWSCLRGSSFWDMWSTWSRKSFRNCEKSRTYIWKEPAF